MKTIQFKLLKHQSDFINSSKKIVVQSGGVGSGKTYSVILKAFKKSLEKPGSFGLLGAQTNPMIRDVVIREFFKIIPTEFIYSYNKTEKQVKFRNGSEIIFRPFDDDYKLRGLTLDFAGIEEMSGTKETIFDELRRRIRGGNDSQLFGSTNPENQFHWIYKRLIQKPIENSEMIFSKTIDNPYLPESYINDLLKTKEENPELFERIVNGQWINLENTIYNLKPAHIMKAGSIPGEFKRYIAGVDFGFTDPFSVVLFGNTEKKYIAIEEIYQTGLDATEILNALKNLNSKYNTNIIYFCDGSRPEIIEYLRKNGIDARKAKKDIFLGIMHIKSLMNQGDLFYSENCINLLKEKQVYQWDKKAAEIGKEIPVDVYNHAVDAERYAIYSDYKNLTEKKKSKKLSWA